MPHITPINDAQQQIVVEKTHDYITRAGEIYQRAFETIPVLFDLSGRSAGMYKIRKNQKLIRFNPFIFAKYFVDNLATTVPHEVAHYIVDQVYGMQNIHPHGFEWRYLMHRFDADDSVTCDYDLTGIPVRTQPRHKYRCSCGTHLLSSHRHNKVKRGQTRYFCRKCKQALNQDPTTD